MTHNPVEPAINSRLADAERLLASAAMVGDAADYRLWQASRDLWAKGTQQVLEGAVDDNALAAFSRAVTSPPGEGSVQEDLPVELEGVRAGMAVLIRLRSESAPAPAQPRPPVERREPRLGP